MNCKFRKERKLIIYDCKKKKHRCIYQRNPDCCPDREPLGVGACDEVTARRLRPYIFEGGIRDQE